MIKAIISSLFIVAMDATCPGAVMPTLSSAELAMKKRVQTLGHWPTDADIASAANVQRVKRLLPEAQFNYLFPRANQDKGPGNGPYSYPNWLKAVAMWPAFCNESGIGEDLDTVCKREMASMFGMWGQEVGGNDPGSQYPQWRQALYIYEEGGCNASPTACNYCDSGDVNYPCVAGQSYYGRGALQLSWNYNYGPFSYLMFGDASVLLKNPGLVVATDSVNSWLSFAANMWFYMTPQTPKPSMHDIAANFWTPNSADISGKRLSGFGAQTMVLNGAVECTKSSESIQSQNRIKNYIGMSGYFGIIPGANTACAAMQQFDDNSSAHVNEYWDKNWSKNCACEQVPYITPYSLFDSTPAATYQKCLDKYFPGQTTATPVTTKGTTAAPTTAGTTKGTTAPTTAATTKGTTAGTTAATTKAPTTAAPTTKAPTTAATTKAPTTAGTTAKTTKPTTAPTTAAPTTASTAKPSGSVCNFEDCVQCTASATATHGMNDDQCQACLWTDGPMFCAKAGSCVCSSRSSDFKKCDSSCTSQCKAIPGNRHSASDAACSPCKGPNPQAWWPCNQPGLCQCV